MQHQVSHQIEIVTPMTEPEARNCADSIKNHYSSIRELVYDLYTRNGWKALGYRNWSECVSKEFAEFSERKIYLELAAAKTERNLLNRGSVSQIPEKHLRPLTSLKPDEQRQVWQAATESAPVGKDGAKQMTEAHVRSTIKQWKQEVPRQPISTFNRTNENIEWAAWSWNPVTGCKTGCEYCYARDIANRFYPQGFEPTFHPNRLAAPKNTKPIAPRWDGDRGHKSVFVCSMADLFGPWVPDEWIDAVLETVRASNDWTYIFLTKHPERLTTIDWPDNAWVGATVDVLARVSRTQDALASVNAVVRYVSCEPLQERLLFGTYDNIDWLIIGGRSKTSRCAEFQPEFSWVWELTNYALESESGCAVYWKANLKTRPREYPDWYHREFPYDKNAIA